jgi:eukaryotic-like serine/threonine-protein kinase
MRRLGTQASLLWGHMQLVANLVVADRFRLNQLLGRGGMGSVWQATHLGLDIPCAVKFIEGEIAQLPEAQARFEREAKAAAQLRSPHVVQILDHGVWQGTPYIAMELLDGEDLGKRLARAGRLPPPDVLRIVTQVSRALTKAHSLGIVHRDLKPDNIFLVRDDDREIAKVLDFGIAKSTTTGIDGSNTKTGAMLGTPYYMSPEQAQGTKAIDQRSDLWSLAIIVFQALTGRLPFESEALGDLLVKIIISPVPMPSQFVSDLPPSFDRWWGRAAQRDPTLRFQTAREFGDSLALALGHSQGADSVGAPRPMFGTNPGFDPAQHRPNPSGSTPHWNAQFGMTPPGATPNPYPTGPAAQPITGGTMSRTFAATPGIPKSAPVGLFIALGGGALAVLALGGLGISVAMKGKPVSPTASGAPSVTLPVGSDAPPFGAAALPNGAPPRDETLQPQPAETLAPAASSNSGALALPGRPHHLPAAGSLAPTAAPKPPVAPPPAPPPPGKKPKVDLGI